MPAAPRDASASPSERAGPAARARVVIHPLRQSGDFRELMATPVRSRSAHFAIHHAARTPSNHRRPTAEAEDRKISTGDELAFHQSVDDLPTRLWLGTMIPKRLARRAVTRNLLRRQVRAAMGRHGAHLAAGMWLVRLRSAFDPAAFRSASSPALRAAARVELDQLLKRAATL